MKLQQFWDEYYWPLKSQQLRECTLAGYKSAWRLHVQPYWGEWDMNNISAREIEKWLFSFEKTGAARKAYNLLRPMLRTAVKYDLVRDDPTQKVNNLPKKKRKQPDTLNKEQIQELLEGFKGSKLEAWLLVAATTGVRKEEGAALSWQDIDLNTGAVEINKGAQWVEGKEIINPPKTQQSYRTVYIPDYALTRLKEIYKELNPAPEDRITYDVHAGALSRIFKKECEKRKLPYIQPRCLRHSWATIALQEGVPISTVSRNLGHYDVSTTARYYIIPRDEELIKASSTFNNVLAAEPQPMAEVAPQLPTDTINELNDNLKNMTILLEKILEKVS